MDSKLYNQKGEAVGELKLPSAIFGLPWNADLVHQVVTAMRANQRAGTAHTKNRGDVAGGGRKPWQQKGTGRARHGSIRSPLWRGGGVTHGPRSEKNYAQKINKKMKTKALFTVLSQKYRDGEVVLVDKLNFAKPQTKLAQGTLNALARVAGLERLNYRSGRRALVALPGHAPATWKSFRNLPGAIALEARNLNPEAVLTYKYLILSNPSAIWPQLSARTTVKK